MNLHSNNWIAALLALCFSAQLQAAPGSKLLFNKRNITTVDKLTGDSSHKSSEGRSLIIFPIQNPNAKSKALHRFYIQGGLHGNERLTSTFVVWLANKYAKGESLLNNLSEPADIDFISVANPDGLKRNYRYNAKAVNLNRNFPVLWGITRENPGKSKFSEPETRAIDALFKQRSYTAAIDVHGYINWVVLPSNPEKVGSVDPVKNKIYSQWKKSIGESIPLLGKYELKTAGELGDGGAFEDWAFWDRNVLPACLEMATATRYAEINTSVFKRGTDTFEIYEKFIFQTFEKALKITAQNSETHLSFSEKKVGKAKTAGSNSELRYRSPSNLLNLN